MFPGLDPYYVDPAHPLTMADEELDNLDHDFPEVRFSWVYAIATGATASADGERSGFDVQLQ